MINRIVLVGNGFDLAHGLKTSYKDFLEWYWNDRKEALVQSIKLYDNPYEVSDELCTLTLKDKTYPWYVYLNQNGYTGISQLYGLDFYNKLKEDKNCEIKYSQLFRDICINLDNKGWVDVENEYYKNIVRLSNDMFTINNIDCINKQLDYLKLKLTYYLKSLEKSKRIDKIGDIIKIPIRKIEIRIKAQKIWNQILEERSNRSFKEWSNYFNQYNLKISSFIPPYTESLDLFNEDFILCNLNDVINNSNLQRPDKILLLNFNYTSVADKYCDNEFSDVIHIHGNLSDPKKVIFGYGDELDENFKRIENLNDNRYLKNVKSTRYMESANYRKLMEFMNLAPYQVIIMGHSCGNSDRTLLNALFEHENCISIKPYYYVDNEGINHYTDVVQNIYRNFTNKADFRDKVVNIEYCEPMPQV